MLAWLWSLLILYTFVYMYMCKHTHTCTCARAHMRTRARAFSQPHTSGWSSLLQIMSLGSCRNISSMRSDPSFQFLWSTGLQQLMLVFFTVWPTHQVPFTKLSHLTLDGFISFTCMCNVLWTARVLD